MVVFESPNSSVGQSNGLIIRRSSVQARLGALLQQAHAPDPKGLGALLFRWLQLEQARRQERPRSQLGVPKVEWTLPLSDLPALRPLATPVFTGPDQA